MIYKQLKDDVLEAIGQLGYWDIRKTAPKNLMTQKPNDPVEVTRTTDPKFGDFSTNVALKIAKVTKVTKEPKEPKVKNTSGSSGSSVTSVSDYRSPQEVAKKLADSLKSLPYLKKLEVAGPGFINFWVRDEVWQEEVEKVLKEKGKYGSSDVGKGKKARVEFVSANPTGPLHFGNARGGPIGDVLASILEFSGWEVLREYIHNDIGGQVIKLGQTIANVAAGQKLEEQEYKGEYIAKIVEKIGVFKTPAEAGKLAVDMILDEVLRDCELMGIKFDKVFPESGFLQSGQTKKALDVLSAKGLLKQQDGALWFAPSDEFLKDRETVVIKSDGSYTYFANDIAYHNLKFAEKYDLVIDIFGANHHGHVPRLRAAVHALGYDESKFHVILYQWVRFKKKGEVLAMSKRSGNFITAKEVLDEVGADALRFFILMHDASSHIDFDLDLAREKSNKNPVYYVQYAHARIASILGKTSGPAGRHPAPTSSLSESRIKVVKSGHAAGARAGAPRPSPEAGATRPDYSLLTTTYELDLIKQISRLPELVEDVARSYGVNQLTTYAMELADAFHRFYENCQVLSEDQNLSSARLGLANATKITLANTLKLLGVSAPEKM